MSLGDRLKARRERLSLTQEQLAATLGVAREIISLWETDSRSPSVRQLEELARLYNVTVAYLLGQEALSEAHEREVIYRGLPEGDLHAKREVALWLEFLDRWADFVASDGRELGLELPGPGKPPRKLDEGEVVTDIRRASALALKVREYYRLGTEALPNLSILLDELKPPALVYRAPLGWAKPGEDKRIVSGAFYNHPRLGYCLLVNGNTTPGRQAFTLAHELAHAFYHYAEQGLVSVSDGKDPKERFANSFAAHFLVPGATLREQVKALGVKDSISHIQAFVLAYTFRVSYWMMLYRLLSEGFINKEQVNTLGAVSPKGIAEQLGIASDEYSPPDERPALGELERFPASVHDAVRRAVIKDLLSPAQAAKLLDIDGTTLQKELLSPPRRATEGERREAHELPFDKNTFLEV